MRTDILKKNSLSLKLSALVFIILVGIGPYANSRANNTTNTKETLSYTEIDPIPNCTEYTLDADPQSSDYINNGCWGDPNTTNTNTTNSHNTPQINSTQAWSAKDNNPGNYVGMMFSQPSGIKYVTTKGRANASQWVTQYKLEGTKNDTDWINLGTYTANTNQNTSVTNQINNTDTDWKGLRIVPIAWNFHPSLRFEFTLCTPSLQEAGLGQHPNSLKINYDISTPLPQGAVVGVNGQVYISEYNYNSSQPENYNYQDSNHSAPMRLLDNEDFLLYVEKGVVSEDLAIGGRNIWLADYVFDPAYELTPLEELKAYIQEHKHLPDVIGQKELDAQGYYQVDKMLMGQLQNLEELVLHTIAQEKKIKAQEEENKALEARYEALLTIVQQLENN